MIIKKLHILSFGGLENFVLEPRAGLNCLCRENEFGKTTLIHFIYYMLFGYEPKRLKNYFPWSGAPMAGNLEFELEGELWRIERTRTEKNSGKTRLLNARTGEEAPLPARQQPGTMLLNIDGETFLKSFCITQGDLPFGYTDGLDKALKNMASTGDEGVSYEQAFKALRDQRVRYANWGRRGGALDQLQADLADRRVELAHLRERLSAREGARKDQEAILEKINQNEQQTANQKQLLEAAQKSDALGVIKRLVELEERQKNAHARPAVSKEQMAALTAAFGKEETAKTMLEQAEKEREESRVRLQYADESLHTFGFTQNTGAELEQAQKKGVGMPLGVGCFALALGGLVAGILSAPPLRWVGLIAAGVLVVLGTVLLWSENNRKTALCRRYGAGSLTQLAEKWNQYQSLWEDRKALAGEQEDLRRREEEARKIHAAKNDELQQLKDATGITSAQKLEDLRVDWRVFEGGSDPQLLEDQRQMLLRGKSREEWEALAQNAVPLSETAEQVQARLQQLREEAAALHRRYSELDTGDLGRLWEECRALEESIAADDAAYAAGRAELEALDQCLDWLKQANEEMNTQFSPKLCALAGEYLKTLTNGKYQELKMDDAFKIRLEAPAGTYEAERFSAGTRDAVYFAFRLAAADLLSEKNLPMILDDPFLNLDDARLQAAQALLKKAAETRQILYFSCKE